MIFCAVSCNPVDRRKRATTGIPLENEQAVIEAGPGGKFLSVFLFQAFHYIFPTWLMFSGVKVEHKGFDEGNFLSSR